MKKTSIPKENADAVLEAYAFLESFLTGHDWLAGDYVSIADRSLCVSECQYIGCCYYCRFQNISTYRRVVAEMSKFAILPKFNYVNESRFFIYEKTNRNIDFVMSKLDMNCFNTNNEKYTLYIR